MPMPNMSELQSVFGNWNPEAYNQGRRQVQFADDAEVQNQRIQQENLRKAQLANLFDEQNNPTRLQEGVLRNTGLEQDNLGKGFTNRKSAVDANIAEQTMQFKINDAQRKELLAIPEHEIKMGEAHAQRLAQSLDPAEQEQGAKLLQLTRHYREEAQKQKDKMEHERYVQRQTTGRHVEEMYSRERIAAAANQTKIDMAASKAKKAVLSIEDQLKSGKLDYVKAASMLKGAAIYEEDEGARQALLAHAAQYEQAELNRRNAGSAGKLDVPTIAQLPAQQITPALGAPAAKPKIGSLAELQKMYPGKSPEELRKAYKAKYGTDLQ